MNRALKIIGIVIGVLIVIIIALPFIINVNSFRPQIEAQLSSALGRKVSIGNLRLSILTGSVSASDVSISDDPSFSQRPFITAKALDVGVEVWPLITSKSLHVTALTLDQPQVALLHSPSGRWNFSNLGNGSSKTTALGHQAKLLRTSAQIEAVASTSPSQDQSLQNLSVAKLSIDNGQISVGETTHPGKTRLYQNVNVTVQNFSFGSPFPFSLSADLPGGGDLKLQGTAGPINPSDTSLTPVEANLDVHQLDLQKSGFVDPSSGIAALADFTGTVKSDGKQATSSGTATASQLELAPKALPAKEPVIVKYATAYDLQNQSGELTQGDVSIGKALAKLTGTFDMRGDSTVLNMKLASDGMPVNDLETMLPALAITLPSGSSLQGGTVSVNATIAGPVDKLVITGPVKLVNTKLAGFDMGSKMAAISKLAGIKTGNDTVIQNFSADVRYAVTGIQTQNINLVVPSLGTLTGNGTISPTGALDYTMTADLSGTSVTGVTTLVGMGSKSAGIPFFIRGTTSDPKFVPNISGMLKSGLADQLKNGLGGQNKNSVVNSITGMFHKKP